MPMAAFQGKKRGEKILIFVAERAFFLEAKPFDSLVQVLAWPKEIPIIWDSAEDHIDLGDGLFGEVQTKLFREFFALLQMERGEGDLIGEAVVKTSGVFGDVVDDPRGGASAHDEDDVPLTGGVGVPEIVEGGFELAPGGIHPRELVQKDDFPFAGFIVVTGRGFQKGAELRECFKPINGNGRILTPIGNEGLVEKKELFLFFLRFCPRGIEREAVIEELLD